MAITRYYVTSDAMGSVTGILDEEGTVIERRSYDAFGEMTCMLPDGSPVGVSPTCVDVEFQGQIADDVTGLYQMGFRWLNTVTGRWLNRDPIGIEGGENLLLYTKNAPIDLSDEIGLAPESISVNFTRDITEIRPPLGKFIERFYLSASLEITTCPIEITGTISASAGLKIPAISGASTAMEILSGGYMKITATGEAGAKAEINFSECRTINQTKVCFTLDAFFGLERKNRNVRASNGQFTRQRFGTGVSAHGELCLDLCNGEFDGSYDYNWAANGNFGNEKSNRTYNASIDELGGGNKTLGKVEEFALLKDYCGGKTSGSCCCEKKYGVKKFL